MNLEGEWYNELGSMMILTEKEGHLLGVYETAVGGQRGGHPLSGLCGPADHASRSVGWIVVWNGGSSPKGASVTAWSGQLQQIDGRETIVATWLHTSETNPEEDWHNTTVGKDIFTRQRPSQEEIEYSMRHGAVSSHPV